MEDQLIDFSQVEFVAPNAENQAVETAEVQETAEVEAAAAAAAAIETPAAPVIDREAIFKEMLKERFGVEDEDELRQPKFESDVQKGAYEYIKQHPNLEPKQAVIEYLEFLNKDFSNLDEDALLFEKFKVEKKAIFSELTEKELAAMFKNYYNKNFYYSEDEDEDEVLNIKTTKKLEARAAKDFLTKRQEEMRPKPQEKSEKFEENRKMEQNRLAMAQNVAEKLAISPVEIVLDNGTKLNTKFSPEAIEFAKQIVSNPSSIFQLYVDNSTGQIDMATMISELATLKDFPDLFSKGMETVRTQSKHEMLKEIAGKSAPSNNISAPSVPNTFTGQNISLEQVQDIQVTKL